MVAVGRPSSQQSVYSPKSEDNLNTQQRETDEVNQGTPLKRPIVQPQKGRGSSSRVDRERAPKNAAEQTKQIKDGKQNALSQMQRRMVPCSPTDLSVAPRKARGRLAATVASGEGAGGMQGDWRESLNLGLMNLRIRAYITHSKNKLCAFICVHL